MPPSQNTINLIRTRTNVSPEIGAIEGSLKRSAYIALSIFIGVGVLTGVIFFLQTLQKNRLDEAHAALVTRIAQAKTKEGMLISIKDRTKIVSGVIAAQKPWAVMLDRLSEVAVPPVLAAVSVDEQNKIFVNIQASSVDELSDVVSRLIALTGTGYVRTPLLTSFQFSKTGTVQAGFTFFAAF